MKTLKLCFAMLLISAGSLLGMDKRGPELRPGHHTIKLVESCLDDLQEKYAHLETVCFEMIDKSNLTKEDYLSFKKEKNKFMAHANIYQNQADKYARGEERLNVGTIKGYAQSLDNALLSRFAELNGEESLQALENNNK